MKQLTMKQLKELRKELKKQGMTEKEIDNLPIYIGDDDELNGIHTGWFAQLVVQGKDKDDDMFVELIKENTQNIPFKSKAILIS